MEYFSEFIWFSLWPFVLYSSYKIVARNVKKFEFKEDEVKIESSK